MHKAHVTTRFKESHNSTMHEKYHSLL